MVSPVDRVEFYSHWIAKGVRAERRALDRIRRALRTLVRVRRRLAADRAGHAKAVTEAARVRP